GKFIAVVKQDSKSQSVAVMSTFGEEIILISQGAAAQWIDNSHLIVLVVHKGEYELSLVDFNAHKLKPLGIYSLYPNLYKAWQGRVAYISPSYSGLNSVNIVSFDSPADLANGKARKVETRNAIYPEYKNLKVRAISWPSFDGLDISG